MVDKQDMPLSEGAIHYAFGLTYASYFVLPRVLMQEMPHEWQDKFVALMDEFWEAWDTSADKSRQVICRGANGKIIKDDLREYRRPDVKVIDSYRKKGATCTK